MESTACLSPWAQALLVVKFDEKHGQQIQSIFPKESLPFELLGEMKMLSMPDCLEPGSTHEFQFVVRVRDKRPGQNGFLNCFISFRQCKDPFSRRGYFQQSVMLVSHLPYISLFFSVLARLSGVLADIPELENLTISAEHPFDESENPTVMRSKVAPDPTSGVLETTLEVAFQHFLQWPLPKEGATMKLPFYGNIFTFTVPRTPAYFNFQLVDQSSKSMKDLLVQGGLEGSSGIFSSLNLVSIFGRLGLIPHLWTLWELMVTGQDIVVWAPSAAVCSSVVTALASLMAPLAFGGDFRPYINPYDTDINLFAEAAEKKFETFSQASCFGSMADVPTAEEIDAEEDESSYWFWDSAIVNGTGKSEPASPANRGRNRVGEQGDSTAAESNTNGISDDTDHQYENITSSGFYVRSIDRTLVDKPPIMLIGITNPFLLRSLSNFQAAIFLPNPEATPKTKKVATGLASPSNQSQSMDLSSFFKAPVSNVTSYLFSGTGGNSTTGAGAISPTVSRDRSGSGNSVEISPGGIPVVCNYHQSIFSPLGIDISEECLYSPSPGSKKKRRKKDYSQPAFSSSLQILSAGETLEKVYDDWIAAGGMKRSTCSGLVVVRNNPLMAPDQDILRRLSSLSTQPGDRSRSREAQASTRGVKAAAAGCEAMGGSAGGARNGAAVAGGKWTETSKSPAERVFDFACFDIESTAGDLFDSERTVVGNLMLREHFKSLTTALMRPFESFFKPVVPVSAVNPAATPSSSSSSLSSSPASAAAGGEADDSLASPGRIRHTRSMAALSPPNSPIAQYSIGLSVSRSADGLAKAVGGDTSTPERDDVSGGGDENSSRIGSLPEEFPPAVGLGEGSDAVTRIRSDRVEELLGKECLSAAQTAATAPTTTRAGATLMVLYSDPRRLLGGLNVAQGLEEYFSRDGAEASLPQCLRKTNWRVLMTLFAESDNFRAWRDWRRDLLAMQMLLESSEACNGLTTDQLIAAFAIEQGSAQLSQTQIGLLISRIKMTMQCLAAIDQRFSPAPRALSIIAAASSEATQDSKPGTQKQEPLTTSAASALTGPDRECDEKPADDTSPFDCSPETLSTNDCSDSGNAADVFPKPVQSMLNARLEGLSLGTPGSLARQVLPSSPSPAAPNQQPESTTSNAPTAPAILLALMQEHLEALTSLRAIESDRLDEITHEYSRASPRPPPRSGSFASGR